MEKENKGRRPRIGDNRAVTRDENFDRYEKVSYNSSSSEGSYNSERRPREGYNSDHSNGGYRRNEGGYKKPYNRSGEGGYNGGGYNKPYNNRSYNNNYNSENRGGERDYNNESGYNASYNNEQGNGGFNRPRVIKRNNTEGGGYNNGGYNSRPQQNNRYNNGGGEGGYQQRPNNRYNNGGGEGGYQQRPNNRYNNNGGGERGGYQQRPNNRYNNNGGGGRPQRREGGFEKPALILRKKIVYDNTLPDPTEPIRLNKYMANAGVCSRREADEQIKNGAVTVNGVVVNELGAKIAVTDVVEFAGKQVSLEQKIYVLLNKPKDCVTTSNDPQGRLTVMDIVRSACSERIYPVGRLDRHTTGVLLLTNDGDLASKLTHPKFVKKKIYHVWTDKDVTEEDMQRIADGLELEDGPIHADAVSYATETDYNQVGIEIHSGRNRIVRRIFEHLGYKVVKLDRVYFAGLTKKNLPRGRWRYLSQKEVDMLRMGAFE